MKLIFKEVVLGLFLAIIVFLALQGFDITPIILLGAAIFMIKVLLGSGIHSRRFDVTNNRYASLSCIPNIVFDDIGGQEAAKREFIEALDFIHLDKKIRDLGIRPLKGILLVGPPGTGKTLMAKAAANYTDSVFIAASGSQFVEMYAGVGAQRVRQLFKKVYADAEKAGKNTGIVFIDEIDTLGVRRGKNLSHMEYDQTLNELLTQIDGIKVNQKIRVLVVAATNRADLLDPALIRPGRFDRIVQVELPDKDGRLHILKIHAQGKPLADDVNLDQIAKETFGFSGAHLESVMNEAAIQALRAGEKKITQNNLREALEKVMLGEKLDRKPSMREKIIIAYHESGHAMLSEKVQTGSVSAITITSRGNALGYIRRHPEEDQYLYTKSELLDQIQICMAGATAEEIIFGQRSTGAIGDIKQAINIAKQLIFAGLSSLGVVDDDLSGSILSQEISRIIKEQEEKVREYLSSFEDRLRIIAQELLDREKLSGTEFRKILGKTA